MAYTPRTWVDRQVEKPLTFTQVTNADGTITLTPNPGTIINAGTPFTADNMNQLEQAVSDASANADNAVSTANSATNTANSKVSKSGDTMTGTLNGTTINASANLQEGGSNLSTIYQKQSNSVYWTADPNGVVLHVGDHTIWLTTAQPAPTAKAVWIQME